MMTQTGASHDDALMLARLLEAWSARLGRQYGPLTRPQRRCMRLLANGEPVRVGDLAQRLEITMAGATRMVDRLEALGYAHRLRAQREDQREVLVTWTPAGEAALVAADAAYVEHVRATAAVLSTDERATLIALLSQIASGEGSS
jgi:DNA-binding MarR family transcriptional regulator